MWPDNKDIYDKFSKYEDYKDFLDSWFNPRTGGPTRPNKYGTVYAPNSEKEDSIVVSIRYNKIILDGEEIDASNFEEVGKAVYKALAKKMLSE